MHWIDWLFVVIPLIVVILIALKSQRYVKGVADFLTAGRVAGRYVVAVAGGEAGLGLISVVAMVEMYYNCGFAVSFWSKLTGPLGLLFALLRQITPRKPEPAAAPEDTEALIRTLCESLGELLRRSARE